MSDMRWPGDQLQRWRDADHLRQLIGRRLATPEGQKGLSIHLDIAAGDGQSFFLNRLREDLQALNHPVAFLDATRDQAAGDPLIALTGALVGALMPQVTNKASRTALEAIPATIATLINPQSADEGQPLRRLIARAQAADQLGRQLGQVIGHLPRASRQKGARMPVFLLIDGVDACRPLYAVSLIERVRHVLALPELVTIMVADGHELGRMAGIVQGEGVDPARFFNRLFDLRHAPPRTETRTYVEARLPPEVSSDPRLYVFESHPVDYLTGASESFGLSLSEIEQGLAILADIVRNWTVPVPIELGALWPLIAGHVRGLRLSLDDDFIDRLMARANMPGARAPKLVRFSFFGAEEAVSAAELFADYAAAAANPIAQGLSGEITHIASIVRARLADEYLILHRARGDGGARSLIADYPGIVLSAGRLPEL